MLHFVLWLAYLIDSSKVIKVGGKQKPYKMWQAGISLAASPLANSLAGKTEVMAAPPPLARSRIPPATQATRSIEGRDRLPGWNDFAKKTDKINLRLLATPFGQGITFVLKI